MKCLVWFRFRECSFWASSDWYCYAVSSGHEHLSPPLSLSLSSSLSLSPLVVQLFNAVSKHQKIIERKTKEAEGLQEEEVKRSEMYICIHVYVHAYRRPESMLLVICGNRCTPWNTLLQYQGFPYRAEYSGTVSLYWHSFPFEVVNGMQKRILNDFDLC